MKDIDVVGNIYVEGSFDFLLQTRDRVQALIHFALRIEKHAEKQQFDLANWYLRAGLGEFKAIFDVVPADLKTLGLHTVWPRSEFCREIGANPLTCNSPCSWHGERYRLGF